MNHNDSLSEQRKQRKEFEELTRRNREWIEKELDALAELLLDLWTWKKEHEEKDEDGSTPTSDRQFNIPWGHAK